MKKLTALFLALLLCMLPACTQPTQQSINTPVEDTQQLPEVAVQTPETDTPQTEAPITAADGTLIAHFIDVGQGDSELLQLPNGQTMLIDAGGDVRSYIKNIGISKIDYLVATHPHSDHIAYIEEVVRAFDIGAVYMPRVSHTSKTFENMLLAIQEKGLSIKTAKAGVSILSADGLTIDIVAPVQSSYDDLNNYSAVIKVTYKNNAMLFTGDAETLSENQIMADVDADVLKVGHHGSSTSSSASFLNRVSPKIAVISCGAGNSYGHPHTEVVQRLNSRNAEIYRTDLNGTVVITSDGINLSVSTNRTSASSASSGEDAEPSAALAAATQAEPDTDSAADSTVVYITRTGKRYHREGCSGLSKSKIPSTVAEATAKGLTACQNCKP